MTGAGGTAAAIAEEGPSADQTATVRSWRRRHWLAAGSGLLVAVALAGGLTLGTTYQPVRYGDVAVAVHGVKSRIVNDFGFMRGQRYIPPQPARLGDLVVSLTNTGPYAVTIESVGVPLDLNGIQYRNGPATYSPVGETDPSPTGPWQKIAGAVLRPGEDIGIRIPFRLPDCWLNGWSVVSSFLVTTKFGAWTHTVEVGWTSPGDPYSGAIMTKLPNRASPCKSG